MHDHDKAPEAEEFDTSSGVPWWVILIGLVVVIFGGVVAVRTGHILIGLVFPPEPPKPANAQQTDYIREMHGVDRWEFEIDPAATCDTIDFYEAQGGTCELAAGYCTGDPDEDVQRESALAATCSGEVAFSAFVMGWEAEVYDYDTYTALLVSRDIPWTRSRSEVTGSD